MKKLLLTSALSFAVTGAAFAQGSVSWTISPAAFTVQTNATVASTFAPGILPAGGTIGVTATPANGGNFYYALLMTAYTGSQLAQPTTVAQLNAAGWSASGLIATNATSAGRVQVIGGATQVVVPGWLVGQTNSIMMAGWSANLGNNWGAVSTLLSNWATQSGTVVGPAFFGTSATGYVAPNNANPGVTLFAAAAGAQGLPIFSLNTQLNQLALVPEPGTLALAALGGASLLLFRRKK